VYCGPLQQRFILWIVHLLFSNIRKHLIQLIRYSCGCTSLRP
jgi:hypothetical protein